MTFTSFLNVKPVQSHDPNRIVCMQNGHPLAVTSLRERRRRNDSLVLSFPPAGTAQSQPVQAFHRVRAHNSQSQYRGGRAQSIDLLLKRHTGKSIGDSRLCIELGTMKRIGPLRQT